jgi:hypothetical protein
LKNPPNDFDVQQSCRQLSWSRGFWN